LKTRADSKMQGNFERNMNWHIFCVFGLKPTMKQPNLLVFIAYVFFFSLKVKGDSLSISKILPHKTSSYFLFTAGYRLPLSTGKIINSGQGFYFETGFNPGKFISKKIILGLYAGWAWRGTAWSTSFHENFTHDYKQASIDYPNDNLSSFDREVITASHDLFTNKKGSSVTMPGCETSSFHNYAMYYGIVFKFPMRWSPVFKVYTGSTRSYYMGNKIVTSDKDYNIFQLRRKLYGAEIMAFRGLQLGEHLNAGALSFYFENNNLSEGELYFSDGTTERKLPLKTFTSSSFLNKYKNDPCFGIRLSFCIL
jgi:hypothetical protein